MQEKKKTKAQIESSINKSLLFIPSDKNTKRVYFYDRGIRMAVSDTHAVISTNFHTHVFDAVTSSGYSNPYSYTRHFVETALSVDCTEKTPAGEKVHSYSKLLKVLEKDKDRHSDFLIAWLMDKWLLNITTPLFTIGGSMYANFIVYFDFLANIAKVEIATAEHTVDLTNFDFIDEFISKLREYTKTLTEATLFEAKSDEEIAKEQARALNESLTDETLANDNQE